MNYSLRDQAKFLVLTFYIALLTIICGCTSYHDAARRGKISTIHKHLDQGGDINARDYNGWTALSLAACYGHSDVVKLLIDRGAEINARDYNGWTALSLAACYGHSDVVKLLIDRGADINVRDNYGRTPLIHAARSQFSHVATVKLLIDRGADIHARDNDGRTPLIHAARCQFSHIPIVKLLIDRGADINAIDNHGCTPLMLATQVTHTSTFKLLLKRNAVVDIPAGSGVLVCFGEMRVTEYDGKVLANNPTPFICEKDISSRFITLPPGRHTINVEFSRRFKEGEPISLTFFVQSGHIYGIEYQIDEKVGKWNAWIKMYK